jgi:hypothetical protein
MWIYFHFRQIYIRTHFKFLNADPDLARLERSTVAYRYSDRSYLIWMAPEEPLGLTIYIYFFALGTRILFQTCSRGNPLWRTQSSTGRDAP